MQDLNIAKYRLKLVCINRIRCGFNDHQEMGSATPHGVEQLAACGGRGAYKANMWRDLRSGAQASEKASWLQCESCFTEFSCKCISIAKMLCSLVVQS